MAIFHLYSKETFHKLHSTKTEKYPSKQKIIAISPHSDDLSVNCGGAMAILAPQNKITPVLFYAGYRGVEKVNPEQGTKIREREMQKEAKILGLKKPIFLRLGSYEKNDSLTIRKDIKKVASYLQKIQPNIIFLPQENDLQPRHKLAAKLTLAAFEKIKGGKRIQLFFYESVWSLFGAFDFNSAFTIPSAIMAKKTRAIRAHRSQLQRVAFDQVAENLASFRAAIVPEQRIGGYGTKNQKIAEYVEVFYQLKMKSET